MLKNLQILPVDISTFKRDNYRFVSAIRAIRDRDQNSLALAAREPANASVP